MNNQIIFIFILLFLSILLLFYYTKLQSNIIILLSLTTILLINYLIVQTEHFSDINNKVLIDKLFNFLKEKEILIDTKSKFTIS